MYCIIFRMTDYATFILNAAALNLEDYLENENDLLYSTLLNL